MASAFAVPPVAPLAAATAATTPARRGVAAGTSGCRPRPPALPAVHRRCRRPWAGRGGVVGLSAAAATDDAVAFPHPPAASGEDADAAAAGGSTAAIDSASDALAPTVSGAAEWTRLAPALGTLLPTPPPPPGVYMVGAGPGDPSLLTLGAVRLLAAARVVLYDRLLPAGILHLAPASAVLVPVGKSPGAHTPQADINAALVEAAAGGGVVVRLKGGDPGVYGRVAEEAAALAPTPSTTVPGITAASGVAASLGFPLTARGVAGSVRFVSGHAAAGGVGGSVLPDWGDLGGGEGGEGGWGGTTLVVYMGLATLGEAVGRLRAGGWGADVPAVAVERGCTPGERVVWGVLGGLAKGVGAIGLRSPVLVVVGHVVGLAGGWRRWAAAEAACSGGGVPPPPPPAVTATAAAGGWGGAPAPRVGDAPAGRGWVPRTVPMAGEVAGGTAAPDG